MQTTQAVGPSFYYNDLENYQKKFEKHIKERESYKRHFQKTQELSCLTRNTNIRVDDGTGHGKGKKSGAQTAGGEDGKPSLFN